MTSLNEFYQSILNIKQQDQKDVIQFIITKEKNLLLNQVSSLDGFCIYLAHQIQNELTQKGITTYFVSLNELVGVDHVSLIAEYQVNHETKRLLIDPTFSQFVKDEKKVLIKFDQWPSEKLDDFLVSELLSNGFIELNQQKFSSYINAFTKVKINLDLDDYLFHQRLGKIK